MADEEELHEEQDEEQVDEEAEDVAEEEELPEEGEAEGDIMDEEVHSPVGDDEAGDAEEDEDDFPYDKMIEELGVGSSDKFVVRLRQQLRTPKRASRFVAELGELIDSRRAEDKDTIFEDFDISQNLIPLEQFEEMCSALADSRVQVERFRAFGSPALDDQAALLLAGWLVAVSQDMAPFEMHLSDCAIQSDGFLELTKAFTENDAFPPKDPRNADRGPIPLYLRLEGNYIEDDTVQEKIEDGTFMTMRKNDRPYYTADHKVRLLLRDDGTLGQRRGTPPAPEDAPPPKRVNDKGGKGKGKGKDADKGKGKGKGKDKGKSREAPWKDSGKAKGRSSAAALPARASWERDRDRPAPWSSRDSYKSGGRMDTQSGRGRDDRDSRDNRGSSRNDRGPPSRYSDDRGRDDRRRAPIENSRQSARPERVADSRRGSLKRPMENSRADEAKRPRTDRQGSSQAAPTKRVLRDSRDAKPAGQRPAAQKGGRSKENGKLPGPWEEHWSEEYGLHYFWNSKTGDSTWERPT